MKKNFRLLPLLLVALLLISGIFGASAPSFGIGDGSGGNATKANSGEAEFAPGVVLVGLYAQDNNVLHESESNGYSGDSVDRMAAELSNDQL